MSLYALPLVGRAGLGNMLFPWARAELFARHTGAQVLEPLWVSFRIGPYLRREPDKRRYFGFFRAAAHHKRGLSGLLVRACGTRFSEADAQIHALRARNSSWPIVVEFSGLGTYFEPLLAEHAYIRDRLWSMTNAPMQGDAGSGGEPYFAMHVRRGDITRQGYTPEQLPSVSQFTPISWFVSMARALRDAPSLRAMPIVVFTDGSEDEVADLLALQNVRLQQRQSALSDLWTLSRAQLLFASGYSTFSMWASYLGGMPTVYAPGKIQQRVQTGLAEPMEIELAGGASIPAAVFRRLEPRNEQRRMEDEMGARHAGKVVSRS